jgi:hypothetical protein
MRPVETEHIEHDHDPAGNWWRWVGILLPPVAWAIQLQVLYLTSEDGCFDQDFKWNHIVSGVMLLFTILGGIIAWLYWPEAGNYEATKEKGKPVVRKRFMGILGVGLAITFAVLVFAQWLPTLTGVPCTK